MFGFGFKTTDGKIFYYTGRAGALWMSTDINKAFCAYTEEGARRFAEKYSGLFGEEHEVVLIKRQ